MSLANKTEEGLIKIKCTGTEELPLDKIKEFQGVLKKRTKAQKEKLLESLKTYGFSFPFFVWKNEGINWCLDGHGRLEVLNSLLNKDQLPTFPVVYVQAEDEAEAKKKLLQLNSQYGEIDTEGLQEFIDGIDIDMSEFELFTRLVDGEWSQYGIDCATDFPELKDGDKEPFQQMTFTLADEQAETVKEAIRKAQEEGCESEVNQNRNGNALAMICEVFIGH